MSSTECELKRSNKCFSVTSVEQLLMTYSNLLAIWQIYLLISYQMNCLFPLSDESSLLITSFYVVIGQIIFSKVSLQELDHFHYPLSSLWGQHRTTRTVSAATTSSCCMQSSWECRAATSSWQSWKSKRMNKYWSINRGQWTITCQKLEPMGGGCIRDYRIALIVWWYGCRNGGTEAEIKVQNTDVEISAE